MSNGKELDQGLSAEAIVALTGVPSGFSLNRGSFDLGDEANELDRETFAVRGGGDYFSEAEPTNVAREAAPERQLRLCWHGPVWVSGGNYWFGLPPAVPRWVLPRFSSLTTRLSLLVCESGAIGSRKSTCHRFLG